MPPTHRARALAPAGRGVRHVRGPSAAVSSRVYGCCPLYSRPTVLYLGEPLFLPERGVLLVHGPLRCSAKVETCAAGAFDHAPPILRRYNTRAAQPGATERGATSAVCEQSPPLPRAASRVTRDSGAPGTLHPPWTAALDPPGATCERPVTPPRLSARRRPSWLWARVLTASAGPPPPVMCAPCVSPLAIAPDHHRSPGAAVTRWE